MKKIISAVLCITLFLTQSILTFAEQRFNYGLVSVPAPENSRGILQVTATASEIHTEEDYQNITQTGPSHAIYTLDKDLNVIDKNDEIITDIHNAILHLENKIIPTFRIETEEVAQAFCLFENKVTLQDAAVISSVPEIIKYIRENTSYVIGIIDYSHNDYGEELSEEEMMQIRGEVNKNLSKIAVLPLRYITRETVEYLQKRLITVWTSETECESITEAMQTLTTGVNGILTDTPDVFSKALQKCAERNALLRRVFVIGHRGNPLTHAENTVEGSLHAYKKGADIIENDIYISKDGVLFVMHDSDISRMTNGTGNIPEMTYEQIRSYTIKGTKDTPIPTLEEYFQAFKGKDVQLFVEIKGGEQELVDELVRLIDEYSFLDQISVISFSGTQLKRLYDALPEISLGYLCSTDSGSVENQTLNAIKLTKAYNSTYNSSSQNISTQLYQQLEFRGITVWPWTYMDFFSVPTQGAKGAAGITTDAASSSADFPKSIEATENHTATIGEEYKAEAVIETYDRNLISAEEYQNKNINYTLSVIILEGEDIVSVTGNNTIMPLKEGTFTYIVCQKAPTEKNQSASSQYYYIYSQPITVTITRKTGDINADGDITIADAMLAFMEVAGKNVLDESDIKAADFDKDGSITIADAMLLFKKVAQG